MPPVYHELGRQLNMLVAMLNELTDEQYARPIVHLSQSTVGQHARHVIELLQCLVAGYEPGEVNYDRRRRSLAIETSRETARTAVLELQMAYQLPDKPMVFETVIDLEGQQLTQVQTTYLRELVYNIEHAIHHMALIKVGLIDMGVNAPLVESFGVANATMQHRKVCAQ